MAEIAERDPAGALELKAELAAVETSLREQQPDSEVIVAINEFHRKENQSTPAHSRALIERIIGALNT